MYFVSDSVVELSFDYTRCALDASSTLSPHADGAMTAWSYDAPSRICQVQFTVPKDMQAPVFLYYRLTNFYQNHRRYVKSVDEAQLAGQQSIVDCSPLDINPNNNLPYYPCGLVANSLFNDTIGAGSLSADYKKFAIAQTGSATGSNNYAFTSTGISWPSDQTKYAPSSYDPRKISPPKDWIGGQYRNATLKDTWAASGATFNPQDDEHFQVWMRTAGLPTFRKLYGKNIVGTLAAGTYLISIEYNFPVMGFDGTKSIVISTTSWLGGKNPFLGVAYIVVGILCITLGALFLAKHLLSPRKLGDHTYLSWNQPQAAAPAPSSS